MNTTLHSSGYDLCELDGDQWAVNVRGGPLFVGTFHKVVIHAVTRMGFQLSEIEFAVKNMIDKNHNAAHFGMYRGFIFTFNREVKDVGRKAS